VVVRFEWYEREWFLALGRTARTDMAWRKTLERGEPGHSAATPVPTRVKSTPGVCGQSVFGSVCSQHPW
jgi:hypothetical protein